ncbi:carbohydrate ABC transporter permease [Actinacidiphila sp. bgisy160]|uniref:carbohydrate ABC transporter permease n=1 Tax=Actinacidiphila sp. bgisy160 TaxID=3413796 RepID=UPI003D7159CB
MTTTIPAAGARRPVPRLRKGRGDGRLAAVLLSPTLLVLGLVIAYPLVAAVRASLFQESQGLDADGFVVEGEQFTGLRNYTDAFTGTNAPVFWNAFWNTTFFTVTTVTIEVVVGLAMALVMNQALRGRAIVRASILVPWAIPTAVSALLWRWVFDVNGVANALLGQKILWTADGWQSKLAVIVADTWKTAPFIGLLVLAGLQLIPRELYEAVRVDGAGPWRQFRSITLPLVKPTLLIAVLFRILDALRMFDLPFVLIGGHKHEVETLAMLAYYEAGNVRYGPAAAYATLLFGYVVIVAFAFVKLLGADLIGEARARRRTARTTRTPAPARKATTA